jgi:hypothetical protein
VVIGLIPLVEGAIGRRHAAMSGGGYAAIGALSSVVKEGIETAP